MQPNVLYGYNGLSYTGLVADGMSLLMGISVGVYLSLLLTAERTPSVITKSIDRSDHGFNFFKELLETDVGRTKDGSTHTKLCEGRRRRGQYRYDTIKNPEPPRKRRLGILMLGLAFYKTSYSTEK
jgi:hypothetical protein